jgi:ubiquinol-cytochrome c reductase cytochrome b subunit
MGYVLPWGQMSFWGTKVIISLFGAIPLVGDGLTEWIMGGLLPGDATLNRFYALHVIALPLVLLLLVAIHILALHEVGSNNPQGIEIGGQVDANGVPLDGIPFHPYYSVEDILSTSIFVLLGAFIIFFAPTFGGWFLEHDNFIEANPLVTPGHIKPVWYFTPYYAMLRVVPSFLGIKLWGVLVMFSAIAVLFFMPWIDGGAVKSIRYRGLGYKISLSLFALSFLVLGTIGAGVLAQAIPHWFGHGVDVSRIEIWLGRASTAVYFGFFAFLWFYTRSGLEKTRPVPERLPPHP